MNNNVGPSSSTSNNPLFAGIDHLTECPVCLESYQTSTLNAAISSCAHRVCFDCRPTIEKCPICRVTWLGEEAAPDPIFTEMATKLREVAKGLNGANSQLKEVESLRLKERAQIEREYDDRVAKRFNAFSAEVQDALRSEFSRYRDAVSRFKSLTKDLPKESEDYKRLLTEQVKLILDQFEGITDCTSKFLAMGVQMKGELMKGPLRVQEFFLSNMDKTFFATLPQQNKAIFSYITQAITELESLRNQGQSSPELLDKIEQLNSQIEALELTKSVLEVELGALNHHFLEIVNQRVEHAVQGAREEAAKKISQLKSKKNQFKAQLLALETAIEEKDKESQKTNTTSVMDEQLATVMINYENLLQATARDLDATVHANVELAEENARLKREMESLQLALQAAYSERGTFSLPPQQLGVGLHGAPSSSSMIHAEYPMSGHGRI